MNMATQMGLAALALVAGCAHAPVAWTPGVDRHGLKIPGSIEGVTAVVHVLSRADLATAWAGTEWHSVSPDLFSAFYRVVGGTCHVYLASDALDALEHEMAHCKYGRWHGGLEETLRLLRQAKSGRDH